MADRTANISADASLKRSRLLATQPTSSAQHSDSVAALQVEQLSVRFGAIEALQDINFRLEQGAFLAIVGPNGAGKSTLIKVALGLQKPSHGRALIFGRSIQGQAKRIGYVPQLKTFDRNFPASVTELVVSGLRGRWPAWITRQEREQVRQTLAQVGAGHLLGRPLAKLSGGELQRAFLARALVRKPSLVLLDEPATGVDFLAEHDLYDLLERYQAEQQATIAMITHDLAAARYHASHVAVLNRRLHGFGASAEVLCEECLRQAYGHVHHQHGLRIA